MAEIIDEFISVNDDIPAPEINNVAAAAVPERSWGEAASDVAGNMLASLASGGKLLHIAAAGLDAGLNTENFQAQKQKRANAARFAELQLQSMENKNEADKFKLEQAKLNAPLDQKIKQNNSKLSELKLQNAEHNIWTQTANDQRQVLTDNFKKKYGYDLLNIWGQNIIDNSRSLQALCDITIIHNALKNNPAQAEFYAARYGWEVSENDKGEYVLRSEAEGKEFVANDENYKKLFDEIQKELHYDIMAARVSGGDAETMSMASIKKVLSDQQTKQLYGTEGVALQAYQNLLNQPFKIGPNKTRNFTNAEKTGHMLNMALQGALEDGILSQREMETLTPLFAATVEQLGGEVIFGDGIDDTDVIIGRHSGNRMAVNIRDFAKQLNERDIVLKKWNEHKNALAVMMAKNGRNAAGGGGDGAAKGIPDSINDVRSNQYGTEWIRLSEEEKANVLKEENKLKAIAVPYGLGEKNKSGKIELKEPDTINLDKDFDNIKIMADEESKMLQEYNLPVSKGYWNRLLKEAENMKSRRDNAREEKQRGDRINRRVYNLPARSDVDEVLEERTKATAKNITDNKYFGTYFPTKNKERK